MWRPEGADQLIPHRAFRWLRTVTTNTQTRDDGDTRRLLNVHDAYTTEPETSRVARLVEIREGKVVVVDFVENLGQRPWVMTIPLGSDDAAIDGLPTERFTGQEDPFLGWFSATYGHWTPAPWLQATLSGNAAAWGVGVSEISLTSESATVEGTVYSVSWAPDTVQVTCCRGGDDVTTISVQHG